LVNNREQSGRIIRYLPKLENRLLAIWINFCKLFGNFCAFDGVNMVKIENFVLVAFALLTPSGLWAADPAPFPDFTFRRVKIPTSQTLKFINVQIDPTQQIRPAPKPAPITVEPEIPSPNPKIHAWFWDHVSPYLDDTGTHRLEIAVNRLLNAGQQNGISAPRLQTMQRLASEFGTDILIATVGTRVSPALVLAVLGVESGGRADAVSPAGAVGLMQLIPATAERFGVVDAKDTADNIRGGVAYLNWLMEEFNNDPIFVLAAYNAGENAVKKRGGVPDFPETRAYVPKVIAAWTIARSLCQTPPERVSDGCVFTVR